MDKQEIREHNEQVKKWLRRYGNAKREIKRYTEELNELIESQEGASAITYSDMPKGSGSQADLSDYMIRRQELQQKIWNARYRRIVVFDEMHDAIEQLPTVDERDVIFYKYIKEMDWDDIAKRIGKKERQTYIYHGDALKNLYNILKNALKCS